MARTMMSVFGQPQRALDSRPSPAAVPAPDRAAAPIDSEDHKPTAAGVTATKLGKTLVFTGDLWVGEEALLLGSVEGTFEGSDSLMVGVGGSVIGDVRGRSVAIKGTVRGNVRGTESVVVFPGAVVTGDILAPRVTIIEGAQFNGSVKMSSSNDALPDATAAGDQTGAILNHAAVEKLLGMLNSPRK
jgi:cytoskeletal protein CcmA (bactofilin family)